MGDATLNKLVAKTTVAIFIPLSSYETNVHVAHRSSGFERSVVPSSLASRPLYDRSTNASWDFQFQDGSWTGCV